MTDLKCPYCPEIRPSRSRLVSHVQSVHRDINSSMRWHDVRNARTVEDVAVTGPELTETDASDVPCVCGLPLVPLDDDRDHPMWTHAGHAPKCRNAIPAAGMPTKFDRADLHHKLADNSEKLAQAGQEMAALRATMDEVDARMARLDAQLTSPSVVRRATLNQVWDKLVDEGHMGAAATVMKMIQRVVDDQ